jgi:hypothetical protein
VKFIEKARELRPDLNDIEIINEHCPYWFELETKPKGKHCLSVKNARTAGTAKCLRTTNEIHRQSITT